MRPKESGPGGVSRRVRGGRGALFFVRGGRGHVVEIVAVGRAAAVALGVGEAVHADGSAGAFAGEDALEMLLDQFVAVGFGVFDALAEAFEALFGLGEAIFLVGLDEIGGGGELVAELGDELGLFGFVGFEARGFAEGADGAVFGAHLAEHFWGHGTAGAVGVAAHGHGAFAGHFGAAGVVAAVFAVAAVLIFREGRAGGEGEGEEGDGSSFHVRFPFGLVCFQSSMESKGSGEMEESRVSSSAKSAS